MVKYRTVLTNSSMLLYKSLSPITFNQHTLPPEHGSDLDIVRDDISDTRDFTVHVWPEKHTDERGFVAGL